MTDKVRSRPASAERPVKRFVFRSQQIHIKAGQHHHLKVVPIRHFATGSFKELSRETRECQLREDIDDSSIFRHYSQKGCVHECILRKLVSSTMTFEFLSIVIYSPVSRQQTADHGISRYQRPISIPCHTAHLFMTEFSISIH